MGLVRKWREKCFDPLFNIVTIPKHVIILQVIHFFFFLYFIKLIVQKQLEEKELFCHLCLGPDEVNVLGDG